MFTLGFDWIIKVKSNKRYVLGAMEKRYVRNLFIIKTQKKKKTIFVMITIRVLIDAFVFSIGIMLAY